MIASSCANDRTRGVAVLCRRNLRLIIHETFLDDEGRLALVKVTLEGRDIVLLSVYAPNVGDKAFFNFLTVTMLKYSDCACILGADFNAVMDREKDRSGVVESYDQKVASEALCQWVEDVGVIDIWRRHNPDVRDFSFYSPRHKSFSRIDYIFTSQGLFHNINKVVLDQMTLTDHKAVLIRASIRLQQKRAPRWRFNCSLLNDEAFKIQFEVALQEFLTINIGSVADPRILWNAIKGFIMSNATLYASTLSKARTSKLSEQEAKFIELDTRLQAWFNDDIALQRDMIKR